MKEKPILFSGPMIRAILDGRKTQTRRVVKDQGRFANYEEYFVDDCFMITFNGYHGGGDEKCTRAMLAENYCPFGVPGDRLWVRETWQYAVQQYCSCPQPSEPSPCDAWAEGTGCYSNRCGVVFQASGDKAPAWRPSIHMPRWASRITLEVTDVRVERLQDISREDALAEGVDDGFSGQYFPGYIDMPAPVANFRRLWDSINGKRAGCSWADNPWVWVVAFQKLD